MADEEGVSCPKCAGFGKLWDLRPSTPVLIPCPDCGIPLIGLAMHASLETGQWANVLWLKASCPGCGKCDVHIEAQEPGTPGPLRAACVCRTCGLRMFAQRDRAEYGVQA